jgi:replicative DNA helicase
MLAIDGQSATPEVSSAKDVMRKHIVELERRAALAGKMDGLETGLRGLDKRLMGLKPEQLIVIAGRAKMGKTTLAMGIVRHIGIRQKKQVLVISLEMSNGGLMDRMLAAEGEVPLGAIKAGTATETHSAGVTGAAHKIMSSGIYLSERPGLTISRIRSMARRHKMTHGLDLLVIDHIGLVDGEPGLITPLQKISEITRQSKLLAKELKIPVIILSQLNRSLESRPDKRPMPSDLRDSGSIEQDCDLCLFVYRDEVYNPDSEHKGIAEVIIGIARDVEQGTEYCRYEGQFNRITDLDSGTRVVPIAKPAPKTKGI